MTPQAFAKLMQPILKIFGEAEYKPERMQLIYEDVCDLPDASLARIVKQFCKDKSVKYPPLPNEFNEAAHVQRKRLKEYATQDVIERAEDNRGPEAMKRILADMGVNNLEEAIGKFRLVKNEEGA